MEDLSSLTTGTGTSTNTSASAVSTPMVTPPERELNWSAGQGGKYPHGLAQGQSKSGNLLPPPQAQAQTHVSHKPRTGSGSSSANIFFKRPSAVQIPSTNSLHSLASTSQQGTRPGSIVPGAAAGYVNARMAREEERRVELEQKRERENKKDGGNGVGGVVVRDGYKIVDGVEKKRSTSGVYTRELRRGEKLFVGLDTGADATTAMTTQRLHSPDLQRNRGPHQPPHHSVCLLPEPQKHLILSKRLHLHQYRIRPPARTFHGNSPGRVQLERDIRRGNKKVLSTRRGVLLGGSNPLLSPG